MLRSLARPSFSSVMKFVAPWRLFLANLTLSNVLFQVFHRREFRFSSDKVIVDISVKVFSSNRLKLVSFISSSHSRRKPKLSKKRSSTRKMPRRSFQSEYFPGESIKIRWFWTNVRFKISSVEFHWEQVEKYAIRFETNFNAIEKSEKRKIEGIFPWIFFQQSSYLFSSHVLPSELSKGTKLFLGYESRLVEVELVENIFNLVDHERLTVRKSIEKAKLFESIRFFLRFVI